MQPLLYASFSVNCIDRHLATRANQVAIIWESDDPKLHQKITYRELYDRVCRLANVLRDKGVKKGDRVITSGGLIGTIVNVTDRRITLKLGDSVRVECLRSAVTGLEADSRADADSA